MASRVPMEAQPDDDTGAIETASKSSQDDVAALLLLNAHQSLTSNERSDLRHMHERYLQDLNFRQEVRCLLNPRSYQAFPEEFRLMDLPTEIRVMIAEHVLTFDGGVLWRWTSRSDGTRVGRFYIANSAPYGKDLGPPVDMLCLSHQLHQETAWLWLKLNELHFDGDIRSLPDFEDGLHKFARAINDFAFFRSHVDTNLPVIPRFIIEGIAILYGDSELVRLSQLTQDISEGGLRLVDQGWVFDPHNKRWAKSFVEDGKRWVSLLRDSTFTQLHRTWRLFPGDFVPVGEGLTSRYLSDEDNQFALRCIDKGL